MAQLNMKIYSEHCTLSQECASYHFLDATEVGGEHLSH